MPGHWHLDGLDANNEDIWDWHYTRGVATGLKSVVCKVDRIGIALDFTMTLLQVPVVVRARADEVRRIVAPEGVEWIPAKVPRHEVPPREVMNATRIVDALDEKRTGHFEKWTKDDYRPDLAGPYKSVTDVRIDESRIPNGAHIFRLWRCTPMLIGSEVAIEVMKKAPHRGLRCDPLF